MSLSLAAVVVVDHKVVAVVPVVTSLEAYQFLDQYLLAKSSSVLAVGEEVQVIPPLLPPLLAPRICREEKQDGNSHLPFQ
tara:strand:+ start:859 stop:1098 length:240 start_codon:yes stop_codon:yes gene_type:complete